jgi:CheY-like chemotaxis protein
MNADRAASSTDQQRGKRRTILVVEDDVLVRAVVAEHLLDLDYRILQAADAGEAVRVLAAEHEVDVVFSDINMPGPLNGLDLAMLIRRDYPHIKVLLASALAPPWKDAEHEEISFLAKPYRTSSLTGRLREMLGEA